jgi:uncharacterized protein (TIGR00369 family)
MTTAGTDAEALARRILDLAAGATGAAGISVLRAEPGRVHLGIGRREDLLQFRGYFHGGAISGLADLAAGGALTTLLPPGQAVVTITLHVNFLVPAKGERLEARASVVKAGGTVGVAAVELWTVDGGDEQLCATATVTFRVVKQ